MATATWNGTVIAQSDDTVVVEGNHYFPAEAVEVQLEDSATRTTCPWKGEASYKTIVVEGRRNVDAAWYYPAPKGAAEEIRDRLAFWKGVEVTP